MNFTRSSYFLAFFTILLWAVDTVYGRWAITVLDVNPAIFSCISLLAASSVLIIIAGPGKAGMETLRSPFTWGYGVFQIMLSISLNWGLSFVSATELNFLTRFSIILSVLFAWMFLNRKPSLLDGLSLSIICVGLFLVARESGSENLVPGLICIFGVALFQTLRTMIAEIHPEATGAQNIQTRCRVTGYVLLVTSVCLLALTFAGAALKHALIDNPTSLQALPFLTSMPDWSDVLRKQTISSAVIFGGTVLPFAMYLYFYVAKQIKTEVFMSMVAFLPFITYLAEHSLATMGVLKPTYIPLPLLGYGGVIVIGAILMIYGRHRQFKIEEA